MKIVSISNSENYNWGNQCDGWHLVKSTTMSLIQERMPAGSSEIRHLHTKAEQFFYILSGTATIEADGSPFKVETGHGLHIPAGKIHQIFNNSAEDLVFIVTSTPPTQGDRVIA